MKESIICGLAGLLVGLAVGIPSANALRPQPGRYTVIREEGHLIRYDSATGRTEISDGLQWKAVAEARQ